MRQGKRRKLTTQDVERAMKWYNAEPVYGHGAGSSEPGYTRIYESGKTGSTPIFVPDEKLIDLRPYALTQSPAILASMSTIQGIFIIFYCFDIYFPQIHTITIYEQLYFNV
jgi:hypothetical protein